MIRTLAAQILSQTDFLVFASFCLLLVLAIPSFVGRRLAISQRGPFYVGSILLITMMSVCGWLLMGLFDDPNVRTIILGLLGILLLVVVVAARLVAGASRPEKLSRATAGDPGDPLGSAMFDHVPVGIWRLGVGGYTVMINAEMCRILELDHPDESSNHTFHSFFTPEALNILKLESFQPGEEVPRQADVEMIARSGRKRLAQVRAFPEFETTGQQNGLLLIVQDISESRAFETENRRLSSLPRLCPFPIMSFTSSGHLIYFNDAARDLARSLGSEGDLAILPMDMQEIIKNCIASGQTNLRHEINLRGRTISWSFFPVKEAQVVHCYAMEITDRLNMESQLRQAQRMESVGQLAGGVAHDFNNLLNVIMGYTGLLQLRKDLRPEDAGHLERISEATDRAAELTQHLLTFSRKQVMQPKTLDLNEVLNGQTKTMQSILGSGIALQCTYAPDLPPVQVDPSMVEQILTNLVANARDAMPDGGQCVISTRLLEINERNVSNHPLGRVGRFVCLSVADTGMGIDPEIMPRLFEPFFTTKGGGKERGLGLAEVQGIVKQHKGWIDVTSQTRQGATFRIYLPATPQEWLDLPEDGAPPLEVETVDGGGETILIVEDEPALLALAGNVLEGFGYQVLAAESGEKALELWREHGKDVDLLLTDMVMPEGISGNDLARHLRELTPELKVVYTSGYNLETLQTDEELEEGVNFLPKPYLSDTLAKTVRNCLDQAGKGPS